MIQTDITTNTTADVIDALDSFYCANVVTALWADAVINRLGARRSSCSATNWAEIADRARTATRSLADRRRPREGDHRHPRQLLERRPATRSSPSPTAPTSSRPVPSACNDWTTSSARRCIRRVQIVSTKQCESTTLIEHKMISTAKPTFKPCG